MAGTLVEQLEAIASRLSNGDAPAVQVDRPRNPDHGDLATNVAMVLAGRIGQPPRDVARTIIDSLDLDAAGIASAEIAGPGFINFRLAAGRLHDDLLAIVEGDVAYGRSDTGRGKHVQVEFVSANPTGPLHVAHGRGAALGDAIASLYEWTGHDVRREFYVNDAGSQIDKLAESLDVRWRELSGESAPIPEGGYHGEYLKEMAGELELTYGERLRAMPPAERLKFERDHATRVLREEQDADLRMFGVHFDEYFSETRLYEGNRLQETLDFLRERGLTYEKDGAVWLRTSEHGDDKDRVLVKQDGSFTYFLPDIAYHRDKAARGFRHVVNVWGADHHGYVPRMQAALHAIGLEDFLDVEIVQMVRIMRGGAEMKMSKRSGEFITLRELIDETGVDVARYFFLMRRSDAQMLFDLDLALDRSEKNPVYKVQYAHARMMSIFRKADVAPDGISGAGAALERLAHDSEVDLIKQLYVFPSVVARAAEARAPHTVCEYLEVTAGMVNSWYHAGNPSRNPELAVLVADPELRAARLVLAKAVKIVLHNGLSLLGLGAPDRMEREVEETSAIEVR
jgi:arginyl-tRNA synthetase